MQATRAVDIDAAAFADAFARRSVAVTHHLVDHPLFTIDAIAEFADRLPPESVRREQGNLPLANSGLATSRSGRGRHPQRSKTSSVPEPASRCRDIQQVPEYAELINECLDEVEELVADREGGMTRRAGYLFISCPASTTPMHFDVEHSFLLQVKGTKHVSVAVVRRRPDRTPSRARSLHRRRGVRLRGDAGRRGDDPSSSPVSACTCRPTCRTGSRRRPASRSRSRSRSSRRTPSGPRACRGSTGGCASCTSRPEPLGASESVDKTKAAVFRSLQRLRGGWNFNCSASARPGTALGERRLRRRRTWRCPSRHVYRESNVYVCVPSMPGHPVRLDPVDWRFPVLLGESTSTRFSIIAPP